MYGLLMAFKDFSIADGIWEASGSDLSISAIFNSYYFERLLRNTVLINIYELIFAFPAPIILALSLNEIRDRLFKRTVQTISYLPHFVSIVVVTGIMFDFLARDGLVNQILGFSASNRFRS